MTSRDVTLLTLALAALLTGSARCCNDPVADNFGEVGADCIFRGCTDKNAENYDPEANVDDGGCLFHGCTDKNANNYDPRANVIDNWRECRFSSCPRSYINVGRALVIAPDCCLDPKADN